MGGVGRGEGVGRARMGVARRAGRGRGSKHVRNSPGHQANPRSHSRRHTRPSPRGGEQRPSRGVRASCPRLHPSLSPQPSPPPTPLTTSPTPPAYSLGGDAGDVLLLAIVVVIVVVVLVVEEVAAEGRGREQVLRVLVGQPAARRRRRLINHTGPQAAEEAVDPLPRPQVPHARHRAHADRPLNLEAGLDHVEGVGAGGGEGAGQAPRHAVDRRHELLVPARVQDGGDDALDALVGREVDGEHRHVHGDGGGVGAVEGDHALLAVGPEDTPPQAARVALVRAVELHALLGPGRSPTAPRAPARPSPTKPSPPPPT
mmetsp:Transcript_56927/g.149992  ORF Transcript_56927/g.149992 Transcript_56927/m.149992 type:complete len:315 (-) Transcript_56927:62-1006(-)